MVTPQGWVAFAPRDEGQDDHMMVHAWFNPGTRRWETPAPWNSDYRLAVANRQHARVGGVGLVWCG